MIDGFLTKHVAYMVSDSSWAELLMCVTGRQICSSGRTPLMHLGNPRFQGIPM